MEVTLSIDPAIEAQVKDLFNQATLDRRKVAREANIEKK